MPNYVYERSVRPEMLPFVPPWSQSLLDIGCGYGTFGSALKEQRPDLEVWGMDSAPAVKGEAEMALDVFVPGLFPDDAPGRRFDCLTFNDSIEHMVDPWRALEAAKNLLTERGVIVVSLPNVRQYSVIRMLVLDGEWRYRESGIMDHTHLRFFTRKSAIDMFTQCRLEVVECVPMAVADRGRKARLLSLLGNRAIEFRARQFAFVVRPARP